MGDLDPKLSAKKNLSKAVSAGFLKRAAASEIDMINIAGGHGGRGRARRRPFQDLGTGFG